MENIKDLNSESKKTYTLTITANEVTSTDSSFNINDIEAGNKFMPKKVYFKSYTGENIERTPNKREVKMSRKTLPRLAFQIYEEKIDALSDEEKIKFPICQYTANSEIIQGIFPSIGEFKKFKKTIEYVEYTTKSGRKFVIYSWNIFSTIYFVQECLRRFGNAGDSFVLEYCEKEGDDKPIDEEKEKDMENIEEADRVLQEPYSEILMESKNIIFRGAPGTGKTFLAKQIASDIVSGGNTTDFNELTDEQKSRIGFVQFHPSYDYSDFVEGLRPIKTDDGKIGFELRNGVFKLFVENAIKEYNNPQNTFENFEKKDFDKVVSKFLYEAISNKKQFEIATGRKFIVNSVNGDKINIVAENKISNSIDVNKSDILKLLKSGKNFKEIYSINEVLNPKKFNEKKSYQSDSYIHALYLEIKKEIEKPYVFIIDEINRGEISKIFGELFFSIDPGYRGEAGSVSTQYSNLHDDPNEKFYIPENVYIIGTMNDIDRSVDSFDFAMRRRFRFIEIKSEDRLEMLDCLGENKKNKAIERMSRLNKAISSVEELNENYHIGAAYYLKLRNLSYEDLWEDYIYPLLQEYIRGMYNEDEIMDKFKTAYFIEKGEDVE